MLASSPLQPAWVRRPRRRNRIRPRRFFAQESLCSARHRPRLHCGGDGVRHGDRGDGHDRRHRSRHPCPVSTAVRMRRPLVLPLRSQALQPWRIRLAVFRSSARALALRRALAGACGLAPAAPVPTQALPPAQADRGVADRLRCGAGAQMTLLVHHRPACRVAGAGGARRCLPSVSGQFAQQAQRPVYAPAPAT